MFNLLRRSKNRKSHKNKNYETNTSGEDEDAEGGTSAVIARNYIAQRAALKARELEHERERGERMTATESYRQFSEEESVREHCRAALPYRRAVIDELEDFGDLDDEVEEAEDEERTTTDNDMFYFEQLRQQQSQQLTSQSLCQRAAAGAGNNDVKEYEKVKLAKTAANLSGVADITRTAQLKTNSAKTYESRKSNVDDNNINKISNALTRAAHGGWAGTNIESQQATVSVPSDASDGYALSLANIERSQNEEAKWQGHAVSEHKHDQDEDEAAVATFGTNQKLIGKIIKTSNRNDQTNDKAEHNNNNNDGSSSSSRSSSSEYSQRATTIKQFNSSNAIRLSGSKRLSNIESQVENAEKSVVNNSHRNNNSNNTATGNDNSDDEVNKTRSTEIAEQTGFGTSRSANPVETVINQVKYRNFDNTQKTRQNETTKRQSRLSLTNFGFGKINTTSNNNNQHVTDACNKDKQQQQQRTTIKPSTTFFGINRKSQQQKSNNTEKQCEVSKKSLVKPLQKSCEFLSDIFMARGRNHNRNRNNHNQHQQQHQHQQQQSSKAIYQMPPSVGTAPPPLLGSLATPTLQMTIENDTIMDDIDNDDQRVVHLETNSDPAACLSTTNSYQMTESNNSNKNFYLTQHTGGEQQAVAEMEGEENEAAAETQASESTLCESARACESNSANEESADQDNNAEDEEQDDDNAEITGIAANVSVPIEIDASDESVRDAAAAIDEGSIEDADDDDNDDDDSVGDVVVELKQANATEHDFIHAANVDQQGVQQLENAAEQRQQRQIEPNERQEGNATDILLATEVRRTNVDGNVDLTECAQLLSQNINSNNNNSSNNNSNNNNNNKEQANCIDSVSVCSEGACDITPMGQSHPNGRTEHGNASNGSRASTPREFRESVITERKSPTPPVALPKITVVDYSDNTSADAATEQSPREQEIFYDFEQQQPKSHSIDIVSIDDDEDEALAVEEVLADDDEVFEMDIPTTVYQQQQQQQQQQRWTRLSHVKLENVPEQEEEEDEEDDDEDEGKPHNDYDEDADEDNLGRERELYKRQIRSTSSDKRESTRSPLKSTNTSDSNLSTSYPDSGIGIDLSQQTSETHAQTHAHAQAKPTQRSAMGAMHARSPFVRDGNSTDCDETLMQCDELNDDDFLHANERLVCIESISLPDVVVESTTATNASSCGTTTALQSSSTAATSSSSSQGEQIININGATGNSVGNVHFIPIHIEGGSGGGGKSVSRSRSRSGSPKQQQRSFDDSCIGSKRSYAQLNGHQMPPTIEIIEDASVLNTDTKTYTTYEKDLLKQELNEQKAHYATQIEDAQKNVHKLEHKVVEMQTKIEKMEQELSLRTWNVERLQGELSAAQKDDEFVRQKLKRLEEEKTNLRHKYSDNEEDARRKHSELETQYQELDEKYKQTQSLAGSLQTQLAAAQAEAEQWRAEVEKIRVELEEQLRILKNALENSEAERKICEDKWQKEFEMLRTHNMEREETLMTDCEWQLRQTQRQWKDKCDKASHERQVAQHKADELQEELTQRNEEVENLRVYEAQVNSLRGVVNEQEHSIQSLMTRIESLSTELETTKGNLELQIEAVAKIKYQCDNAIYDKERQMIYRIDEVRNEAAAFWEDKLYTEMTRLKNELESVYVDERREALDKLQVEHIEELRALTTRYTANEDELRTELEELQERLGKKSEEYLQLREKSDNSLLQTRMHLDRADRDFQAAMCREEERREALEQKLQQEYEAEKEEMEEKFRERLGQVKDEFAKELQLSTQDMVAEHRMELEKQKAKLIAEKERALQELTDRHRNKLAAVEENIKDIELRHKRDLKDLKAAYDAEKAALDKRDISNANEIEMLHRKCRCLTNLFEEMRMRYERRDPRQEDLREIAELRGRCESQERDLYVLTDRLREMQIQMTELQQNGKNTGGVGKQVKKPPPKTIPTSCDVIYEENEERESPPPQSINTTNTTMNNYRQQKQNKQQQQQQQPREEQQENDNEEDDEDEDEEEDDEEEEASETESNHKIEINGKNIDSINEDDAHMITAV